MGVNKKRNDWNVYHPHIQFAYNNPDNAATGLASNENKGENIIHFLALRMIPIYTRWGADTLWGVPPKVINSVERAKVTVLTIPTIVAFTFTRAKYA